MRSRLEVPLKLKAANESGLVEGYASVFDLEDRHGEAVARGAFMKTIADNKGKFPLLWQHDPADVVGATMEIGEDARGLPFSAQLNPAGARFAEVLWLLREKAVRGVSIGFRPIREHMANGIRVFTEVQLFEISLVTVPANPEALVTGLKSESNELAEAIRQFLKALRPCGPSGT